MSIQMRVKKSIESALKEILENPHKVYAEPDLVYLLRSNLEKDILFQEYQIHQEIHKSSGKSNKKKFDLALTNKWNPKERRDLRRNERRKDLRPKLVIEVKHLDPSGSGTESVTGDLKPNEESYVGIDVKKLKEWIEESNNRQAFMVIYSLARGARKNLKENLKDKLDKLLENFDFHRQKAITKETCLGVTLLVPPEKNLNSKWSQEPTHYYKL